MMPPTRREKCNHNILKCGGCGEFVAMMTRAEERLIRAALRVDEKSTLPSRWQEFAFAARAVSRERERDAKKESPTLDRDARDAARPATLVTNRGAGK